MLMRLDFQLCCNVVAYFFSIAQPTLCAMSFFRIIKLNDIKVTVVVPQMGDKILTLVCTYTHTRQCTLHTHTLYSHIQHIETFCWESVFSVTLLCCCLLFHNCTTYTTRAWIILVYFVLCRCDQFTYANGKEAAVNRPLDGITYPGKCILCLVK